MEELFYYAALSSNPAIGPKRFQKIRDRFEKIANFLDLSAPGTRIWGLNKPGYRRDDDPGSTDQGAYRWAIGTKVSPRIRRKPFSCRKYLK